MGASEHWIFRVIDEQKRKVGGYVHKTGDKKKRNNGGQNAGAMRVLARVHAKEAIQKSS